jgi:hypothetical protein
MWGYYMNIYRNIETEATISVADGVKVKSPQWELVEESKKTVAKSKKAAGNTEKTAEKG